MTDMLKMKPSALDQLNDEPSLIDQRDRMARLFLDSGVIRLQERAFRDGAKAEHDRILKMLREPSDELVAAMSIANCNVGQPTPSTQAPRTRLAQEIRT